VSILIEAKDVSVKYGDDTVLDISNLKATGPGMVVITGPNGAGKSTLLRLWAGLQRPQKGTVQVNGVKAHRRKARLECGYSPDHPVLFDDLTIADNIRYACETSGTDEPTDLANSLIDAFEFEAMLDHFPSQLSRGQQQAASLVVAMARPVEVMLLDEPTLALDQVNQAHLANVLASHTKGRLLVVASHEPGIIEAAGRNIRLEHGRRK
jgi:ABC-type multidrug transport system ATPase subunit